MDKNAIKKYAVWARRELIECVSQRAMIFGITEKDTGDPNADSVNGHLLSQTEKRQRQALIRNIKDKGYEQVMEEVAYTWFNRFAALRFMEVNGYLPSHVRVFTNDAGEFKPQILAEAIHLEMDGLDMNKVYELANANKNEELFKYLLIVQCNSLNSILPGMFQKIEDYTELLLPDYLLREGSVIEQMVTTITEEDWTDQVQIIGWLYQYYNTEPKDKVFENLKKNIKITKENIPAATQLFTPDWIVRYMVENSLGRLWLEGHPNDALKSEWKYYLDEAKQEPEVEVQLQKIRAEYATIKPEEIKVIDPCMGSGHILVYAFDILMQIYTSAGWSERDATKSILENNLYGLDIDDRAGQLAYFAIMMKARKHSRRILNGEVRPNILSIRDSDYLTDEFIAYVADKDVNIKADLAMLRNTFKDAKEYGSILNVPVMHYESLYERIDIIRRSYVIDLFQAQYRTLATDYLLPIVKQAQIMAQKYDVVVTNPPYMGASGMGACLEKYIKENFVDSKSDLFSAFIEKCKMYTKKNGFQAMITMQTWMFLKSFEALRQKILVSNNIICMAYFGIGAFGAGDVGSIVQTVSFCLRNSWIKAYAGVYSYLYKEPFYRKEEVLLEKGNLYYKKQCSFADIPGQSIAFWLSDKTIRTFSHCDLQKISEARIGLVPGNNAKYIRLWTEVSYSKIGFSMSREEAKKSHLRWFPYNKGGQFRKWYGNLEYVVDWLNDGYEMQNTLYPDGNRIWAHNFNLAYIFLPHIGWTDLAMELSFRFYPSGVMFDSSSNAVFTSTNMSLFLLGYLNCKFVSYISSVLNPTFHFKPGDYYNLPFIDDDAAIHQRVENLARSNLTFSKSDWDSFETSWDFRKHPLI